MTVPPLAHADNKYVSMKAEKPGDKLIVCAEFLSDPDIREIERNGRQTRAVRICAGPRTTD